MKNLSQLHSFFPYFAAADEHASDVCLRVKTKIQICVSLWEASHTIRHQHSSLGGSRPASMPSDRFLHNRVSPRNICNPPYVKIGPTISYMSLKNESTAAARSGPLNHGISFQAGGVVAKLSIQHRHRLFLALGLRSLIGQTNTTGCEVGPREHSAMSRELLHTTVGLVLGWRQ